jgi:hypothetical protein
MGVNPNFRTLRTLMILRKEELECCIVKLEEGQGVAGPERAAGHEKVSKKKKLTDFSLCFCAKEIVYKKQKQ